MHIGKRIFVAAMAYVAASGAMTSQIIYIDDSGKGESNMLAHERDQVYRTVRWTQSHYRTKGQEQLLRFVPLYEIADEAYTIYFPIKK